MLLDKKSRTSIMYGVIICLSIAIIFCVVKIATRPDIVKEDNNYYLPVKEKVDMEEIQMQVKEKEESQEQTVKLDVHNRARLIEDNVNIRSGPGTEYERLGSAYKGYDFKIISGEGSEWIKIEYDGKPAYVYAEYVEVVPMFLNDMGVYEEYVEFDNKSTANTTESEEKDSENEENAEESTEDQLKRKIIIKDSDLANKSESFLLSKINSFMMSIDEIDYLDIISHICAFKISW